MDRLVSVAGLMVAVLAVVGNARADLVEKTMVVWASPANLSQQGGSALTIDDLSSNFDGVVYAERAQGRWMPGSEGGVRTLTDQSSWPVETAAPGAPVQIAIVYRGNEITMYRNGDEYARYPLTVPLRSFGPHSVAMFGRRHMTAGDPLNSFVGTIADARIYDGALDVKTIAALRPSDISGGPKPWAWWPFATQGLREATGRFPAIRLIGDPTTSSAGLKLGGNGATVVYEPAITSNGKAAPVPGEWAFTGPVPSEVVQSVRLFRERLMADPYRPGYHFAMLDDIAIAGDPNGAFYANGRYHLMYIYARRDGSGVCWGHISSTDLVHWRNHPDSISTGDGDIACCSGGAFVDTDGSVYISYWTPRGDAGGIGLAKGVGPYFDKWDKFASNPVIRSSEFGITYGRDDTGKMMHYGSADPSNIWKKDGRYYMLTGSLLVLNKFGRLPESPIEDQGDRAYLFVSDDLEHWKFLHVFYDRRPEWTDRSEDDMCPSFMPLPSGPEGGAPSGKHLLLFISHNKGCQYYVGDYRDDRFYPDNHGRMTWINNTYFAPEAMMDGKGRQIMWAWLLDNPPDEETRTGWSGVYGLPRSLWLGEDGTLRMRPVSELDTLHCNPRTWSDVTLSDGGSSALDGVVGDSCEIRLEIDSRRAAKCGLRVRASADGEEQTLLYYDAAAKELVLDGTKSGMFAPVERAPFELKRGEKLKLTVFIDKSVVEIYANDRQAICRRVYPKRSDSLGVSLFTEGGTARFSRIQGWEMMPSNPY